MPKTKVLYIDDETLMRRAFDRAVRRSNFAVKYASTGNEAMGMASVEMFDIVVSDYRLTDLDGMELLRRIHALQPEAFLILVSGYFDAQAHQDELNGAGITAFVAKPWDNKTFVQLLESFAAKKSTPP